jgi:putative ABC transport system permease protein
MARVGVILRVFRLQLSLAFRNVVRQPRRTASGVVAISFAVAALILAAGFIEWSNWALRENTIRSRLGHIQIVREGYTEFGLADPFAYLLPETSPDRHMVETLPDVVTVAPRLVFSGLISLGDATLSFMGEGMDPAKEAELARSVLMSAGDPLAPDDQEGIILGQGLAANLGAKVGDKVVLLATIRSGGINAVEARVRGLFSTVSRAYDDAALRVPLSLAQRLLRTRGAHMWVVLLDDTDRTEQLVEQVRGRLQDRRLDLVPWYQLADFYKKTVALLSKQVGVIRLIIAVIIVLGISNSLMMSVAERTGEIGTAMALGVTRQRLLGQFLGEGVILGFLGGLVGLVLGIALARLISRIGIPLPAPPGQSRGYIGEIFFTWWIGAEAVTLAVFTTLLASVYPAWRASRMVIVDALRHNR